MAVHGTLAHPAPRWGAPKHLGIFLSLFVGGILTITAVAIAAIVITSEEETSVGTTGLITGEASIPYVKAAPAVLYYLVATPEEAARFSVMAAQDEAVAVAAGIEVQPKVTIYLAIDSPEREAMLAMTLQELYMVATESGGVYQVIDLRTPE